MVFVETRKIYFLERVTSVDVIDSSEAEGYEFDFTKDRTPITILRRRLLLSSPPQNPTLLVGNTVMCWFHLFSNF